MLYNAFIQIVGNPPIDLEFLPYIFSCSILYFICRYIVEFICSIFKLILKF